MSSPALEPVQPLHAYAPVAAEPAPEPRLPQRLMFTGSGSEYFRIWIVNLLLTIVTLGIYSAWAKVRKTRYFYDNTQLDGSSFEYHGQPLAILKGRIIAAVLILAYNASFNVSSTAALLIMLCIGAVLPWLIWKSLQFKLFNSSYRGIRFGFRGSAGAAYFAYLLMPLCAFFSLFLLTPLAHQQMKKFQHSESRFGSTFFSFAAGPGSFFKAYLIGGLAALGGIIVIGILFGSTLAGLLAMSKDSPAVAFGSVIFFIIAVYVWMFSIYPLFMTMIQNLIWNHTQLGPHRFASDIGWGRMSFIMVTNLIGIAVTLGLFIPFAQVRSLKYRLESLTFIPADSLDHFIADNQSGASATGEGMADLLGFDLSL